ncbi:MAG TPA: PPOX class F420-dependent oxidoreductase [Actinomycetes bacterium]|nr:PPOX class F420-dependent oxidoreductase [Actinomycetes bacterium]
MELEQAQELLRHHHRAVMATFRADGRPQLSPVLATLDAAGRVVVSTREPSMKVRNLRRDPRISLCLLNPGFFGDWAQVEGVAEIVGQPDAMEPLIDYYRSISGEHPDWGDYRAAMVREQRVVVRFEITRAGPTVAG